MKKFLLCILASFSLPCFGTRVCINLVAGNGEAVRLIGDYYNEHTNTITTPFRFVNRVIQILNFGHEGPITREADKQTRLLEYFANVSIPALVKQFYAKQ